MKFVFDFVGVNYFPDGVHHLNSQDVLVSINRDVDFVGNWIGENADGLGDFVESDARISHM